MSMPTSVPVRPRRSVLYMPGSNQRAPNGTCPQSGYVADTVAPGDYVIVHVGFAISKVDQDEAQRTFDVLREMSRLDELEWMADALPAGTAVVVLVHPHHLADKLAYAKPDALVMHPGPMNRGVELDSDLADDVERSVIREQVEMGVAVRMACLDVLTQNWSGGNA